MPTGGDIICYNSAMRAIHMTAAGPADEVLRLVDIDEPEITAPGARIATTVSTPEKARWAEQLGAERTINYLEHEFADAVMEWTAGRGVDVVLDSVGGETFRNSMAAAAIYGQVVTLLDPGNNIDWKEARNRNLGIHFTLMLTPMLRDLPAARLHQGEILRQCAEMIEAGTLKPLLSASLPLQDAARAHELIEEGHVQGKIVLTI